MPRDGLTPVRMQRIAMVAPAAAVGAMLERVGDTGVVELEPVTALEETREAELRSRVAQAVTEGPIGAVVGWAPAPSVPVLAGVVAPVDGVVVPLDHPPGVQPPTLMRRGGTGRAFDPLVEGYGTVAYADVDPTLLAGIAYVVMFGMMFGDLGHGLLLLAGALLLRSGRIPGTERVRRGWTFVAGAGVMASAFGVLYGEFFGPTGVLPTLWLSPTEEPIRLLVAAVAIGAVLLTAAYVIGTINRVREGGWGYALYARSGVAGGFLFLALGCAAGGIYLASDALVAAAVIVGLAGVVLAFVGLLTTAGGGPAGVLQAVVELFDLIIRSGANLVSFARLAAFGLAHAALSAVVWEATVALWAPGLSAIAAVLVFVVGTAVALTLEALVAGIQAMRLAYYELFSRVFDVEGRPFRPWTLPAPSAGSTGQRSEVSV